MSDCCQYSLGRDVAKILTTLEHVMTALDDLNAKLTEVSDKVTALQATVDADQASDAAVIAALNQQIVDLQAIIDGAIPASALPGVLASLQAIGDAIDNTTVDVAGPNS